MKFVHKISDEIGSFKITVSLFRDMDGTEMREVELIDSDGVLHDGGEHAISTGEFLDGYEIQYNGYLQRKIEELAEQLF